MASAIGKNTMKYYIYETFKIHILESMHMFYSNRIDGECQIVITCDPDWDATKFHNYLNKKLNEYKNRLDELTKSHLSTTFTIEINRKQNDSEFWVLHTRWETDNTNPFEELFDEIHDDDDFDEDDDD